MQNATNGPLDVAITRTLFSRNHAVSYLGSGGAFRLSGQNLTCNISDSVMVLNTAELDGGGIYIALGPHVHVNRVSFIGNEVFRGGAPAIFAVVRPSL